jgi:hypothetical protein
MEENNVSTNKHAISSAVPVAVVIILLSILYYVFDVDARGFWGYLMYAILLAGIIWGVIQLRDKFLNGAITYGHSFGTGTLISLYTGLITGIYTFVFYKFFAPEQIQVLLEKVEEQMIEKSPELTDQQLDMALAMTEKFMTPGWMGVTSFFGMLVAGVILSLIASIFLKKEASQQY